MLGREFIIAHNWCGMRMLNRPMTRPGDQSYTLFGGARPASPSPCMLSQASVDEHHCLNYQWPYMSSPAPTITPERVIETFMTATEENQLSSLRQKQTVHLPAEGDMIMTGDMHDHRRNFQKVVRKADL